MVKSNSDGEAAPNMICIRTHHIKKWWIWNRICVNEISCNCIPIIGTNCVRQDPQITLQMPIPLYVATISIQFLSALLLYYSCDNSLCFVDSGTTQAVVVRLNPILNNSRYYSWNDGVGDSNECLWWLDYDRLCHILLSRINSPSNNYTIINNSERGGLGHKLYSLSFSIIYAIVLKRNFRSDFSFLFQLIVYMNPVYWDHINSCLNELRYDGRSAYSLCIISSHGQLHSMWRWWCWMHVW